MGKKRKQIIFLFCITILVIAAVGFWVIVSNKERLSTQFQENDDDIIVYGGKKYQYNEHLSNFLFLGIDTREPVETYETREEAGQADSIFLLSLDRVEKTVQCLVIPRDTITDIQMFALDGTELGSSKDHINIQYAFGDGKHKSCELMKETVSHLLYDLPIQGYCSFNMDAIPIAVEVIEGVELIVPNNSLVGVNPEFQQGAKVTITKETAEQFVRYRNIEQSQSAIDRMNRQIVFMEAYANKAKTIASKDSNFIVTVHDSLEDYMVTNIGNEMFAKILESSYNKEDIRILPGEGIEGDYFDEYHVDEDQLYELILEMFYEEVQE